MNKVLILRGVSGAGKSSYAQKVAKESGAEQVHVVSADDFFMRPPYERAQSSTRDYRFDPTKLPMAHSWCMCAFLRLLGQREEFIVVDNTNIHRWEYEPYELAARASGYDVEIVEVMPVTLEDLKECARRNVHGVPREVVARMAIEFEPDSRARKFNSLNKS